MIRIAEHGTRIAFYVHTETICTDIGMVWVCVCGCVRTADCAYMDSLPQGRFTQDAGVQRLRGRMAGNQNMNNVHISFSLWVYQIKIIITANSTHCSLGRRFI